MFSPSAPDLIGQSAAWLAALDHVSMAAPIERPLLVVGERGSGKELIAERLHFLSLRWEGPFVKVNCAALSDDLLDSELFGHEQGAFTGATKRRAGRFEQADGGTLFLDEIATASLAVQEKLLRVIEYGEFQRLGGEDVLATSVRVIAATNIDLPAAAARGDFRADLLDRLAFDVVSLPPLRARRDDITLLADYFGLKMARELGTSFPGFAPAAIDRLEAHDWPGNVRELKNAVERAVYRDAAMRQAGDDASLRLAADALDPFASPHRPPDDLAGGGQRRDPEAGARPPAAPALPIETAAIDFSALSAEYEKALIDHALTVSRGRQKNAAAYLSLSYNQLRGLLRKYGYGKGAASPDAPDAA